MADAKKPAVKKAVTKKAAAPIKKQTVRVKYSEMKLADLQSELASTQQDLLGAKRSHKGGELVNVRTLTETRKTIARILTAIRVAENADKESK